MCICLYDEAGIFKHVLGKRMILLNFQITRKGAEIEIIMSSIVLNLIKPNQTKKENLQLIILKLLTKYEIIWLYST